MKNNKIMFAILLVVGCLLGVFAGMFKEGNEGERYVYRFELKESAEYEEVIDLAEQGTFKYYLQPNVISVQGRFKNGNLQEPLRAEFTGLPGYVSQGSKKSYWPEAKPEDNLTVITKGYSFLNVEVELPRSAVYAYDVGRAVLQIRDAAGKLTTVKFRFINSKYL